MSRPSIRRSALAAALVLMGAAVALTSRSSRAHENEPEPAPSSSAKPEPPPPPPIEVVVKGDKGLSAASADEIRARDLMLRPRVRPGDILEVVPGLFAVQHAGGGKANQYFLRGFDADHGTDIAFFVDGVPVNMVSHGHGQGYSDFHFLIPELVRSLSVAKGPYLARYGDFATAGAIDLHLTDHVHESSVTYQIGRFGIHRGLFMVSPELGDDWSTVIAGEAYTDNGPFAHPEGLRRFNAYGRATRHLGAGSLSVGVMSYSGGWNASGQIPKREVDAGRLDRFGAIDPSEGGTTQRHQVNLSYIYRRDGDEARALVYLVKYRFSLFSNFTFFAADRENGDQINQEDDRTLIGTHWYFKRSHELAGGIHASSTIGFQARHDAIDNALHHTVQRRILDSRVDATVAETSVGLYAEEELKLLPWLRLVAGLRLDRFDATVRDHLKATAPNGAGTAGATLVSPKASLVLSPAPFIDLFLNFGRGFHSNDARSAVLRESSGAPSLLAPATGYEAGTRIRLFERIDFAAALFRLDLDSEIVWVGDEGTTEARESTRRIGVELEARVKLMPWLFLDADATFTKATFAHNAGNGGALALAPTRTFAGGVSFKHPDGPFGALRIRSIAKRPANDGEDRLARPLDAEGFTLLDATLGYRWRALEGAIDVRNVLDSNWKEVQFANTSKLRTEFRPVQDIHFTPGWPLTVLARATVYW